MDINHKWTVQMKNPIEGIMLATLDPLDHSVFYVSDGWNTAYSRMRFRKLSIETGEEIANALTRDGARCMYCDKEHIYVFLTKRILKLHRNDLTIAYTYKEKVPRATDYVESDGANTFLLANHIMDSLSVFDLQTGHIRRKKIGGCCGIFKTDSNSFFIFNYNSILEYSLEDNKLNKLADTEKYMECVMAKSGRAYLLCPVVYYNWTGFRTAEYNILIYSFVPEARIEKVIPIPEEICSHLCANISFRLSEDEKWLYLFDPKSIWIYSIYEDKILFQHTFQSEAIHNVFADKPFIITLDNAKGETERPTRSEREYEIEMAGWEFSNEIEK